MLGLSPDFCFILNKQKTAESMNAQETGTIRTATEHKQAQP